MTPAGVPSCVGWQGACVYDLFQARRGALWTRVQRFHRCHSSTEDGRGPAGKDPPVHVRPRAPWARRALRPLALVARLRRAVNRTARVHRSARATAHAPSCAKARSRAIRCADGDQQEAIEQLVYNGGQWPAGASFRSEASQRNLWHTRQRASATVHKTTGPPWSIQCSALHWQLRVLVEWCSPGGVELPDDAWPSCVRRNRRRSKSCGARPACDAQPFCVGRHEAG